MKKSEIIKKVEENAIYCKVKIDKEGNITGVRVDRDYRFRKQTNTGGRLYLGNIADSQSIDFLT